MCSRISTSVFLAATLMLLPQCSDEASDGSICGAGRDEVVQGEELCIYDSAVVIETGFDCPVERPVPTEIGGIGVCSERDLSPGVIEEIRNRFLGDVGDPDLGTTADVDAGMFEDRGSDVGTDAGSPAIDTGDGPCTFDAGCRVTGTEGPFVTTLDASPLDTLECMATAVVDGIVPAAFTWEVTEAPDGSSSTFAPNASVANPTFFVDLAGQYELTAGASDMDGEVCASVPISITSLPCCEDLHVQLVWQTPGVDDVNGYGDLDLHFLRGDGTWNEAPDDCFYGNRVTVWGESEANHAALDMDDDSAGPENINLDEMETDVAYHIGVHYQNDKGLGATLATVRVFVSGVMLAEYPDVELTATGSFCEIATLSRNLSDELDLVDVRSCQDGFPD